MSRYLKDFEEIGRIGRGGFGSVYCARQRLDGREYAVKKVKLSATDEAQNVRVTREVKNMAALSAHPNIVRYYGTWVEADGQTLRESFDGAMEPPRPCHKWLYIQMELCSTSLRKWMDEKTLDIDDVHTLLKEVSEGLRFMHSEGFIHRDVKPENIFIVSGVAKLGDFGLSCKTGGHLHEAFQDTDTGSSLDSETQRERPVARNLQKAAAENLLKSDAGHGETLRDTSLDSSGHQEQADDTWHRERLESAVQRERLESEKE
eukprot:CAMPEP_0173388892 /NCGR_PEP_ID=MMETSP1356-20130122/11094_1 /TAXON_ID=77927 ORGANISM="Hemiselmis virescens, Strain PCC157" /NCGR_SAMPLE_ID=MMETSP1356 /ASSEMBLY_ACC=CAM_ASM_000847 /LENGTH=260 /DNA_ID=CAMNT_0014345903 /DNA_START=30 /DNA_END=809 /DNA_ORIENTATION=-